MGVLFVTLLEEHISLIPVREGHLPGEGLLIDGSFDGLVSVLRNRIFKALNQILFGYNFAISMKLANEVTELVQVKSGIGSMGMLKPLELFEGSTNVTSRKSIIAMKKVSPSSPVIVLGSLFHLGDSRATTCGGFELLIHQFV